jgi:hypothetical protein
MGAYEQVMQHIDPATVGLLNSPQMQNAQIAQQATDNDDTVTNFRDGLRGFTVKVEMDLVTGKKTEVKKVFGKPAMNEEGVNELTAELQMYLSKTYILSNVPKDDKRRIDAMARIIWSGLNQKLIINAQRYELDKSRRPTIVHTMVFIIIANAMRGYEDGERGKYYGSNRVVQTISTQNSGAPVPKSGLKGMFGL